MTKLQPVLDGFNHTLENLSREVEGLSLELKSLRHEQESISKARHAHDEKFEKYKEDSSEQMQKIWKELHSQQKEIKQTVQLQQDHLLHNMTNLKNKTDHYVNMSHEEMQVTHHYLLLKQPLVYTKLNSRLQEFATLQYAVKYIRLYLGLHFFVVVPLR